MSADGFDIDVVFGDGDEPVTHSVKTYLREGLLSPRAAVTKLVGDTWIYRNSWWLVLISTVGVLAVTYAYGIALDLLGFRDAVESASNQLLNLSIILLSPVMYLVQRFVLANIFVYGQGHGGFGNRPICASTALTYGNSLFVTAVTYGSIVLVAFLSSSLDANGTFSFFEGILLFANGVVLWAYNAIFLSQGLSVSRGKGVWLAFISLVVSMLVVAVPFMFLFYFAGQFLGFDTGLDFSSLSILGVDFA